MAHADLHTHTTASDGVLTPAALIREASSLGLGAIAITDHDTTAGVEEGQFEAARRGIECVPGVELGTGDQWGDVHLLGYFVRLDHRSFHDALNDLARQRFGRMRQMVDQLNDSGVPLRIEDVVRFSGTGSAGRPHVARALVDAGHASSVADAFERYVKVGRPGYVPRPKLTPERGIALIREAGGVPVMAHPHAVYDLAASLARLVPNGLAGLETDYGEYDEAKRQAMRLVAEQWDLIPTGGSDFHAVGLKEGRVLGGPRVSLTIVDRLRAAADTIRSTTTSATLV